MKVLHLNATAKMEGVAIARCGNHMAAKHTQSAHSVCEIPTSAASVQPQWFPDFRICSTCPIPSNFDSYRDVIIVRDKEGPA